MRLTVELDPGAQPIAGWIQAEDGPKEAFVGMVELISLLEGHRQGAGSEAPAKPAPEQPGDG